MSQQKQSCGQCPAESGSQQELAHRRKIRRAFSDANAGFSARIITKNSPLSFAFQMSQKLGEVQNPVIYISAPVAPGGAAYISSMALSGIAISLNIGLALLIIAVFNSHGL